MSTSYIWKFTDRTGGFYEFKATSSEAFDFVVPDSSNCENFSGFNSNDIRVFADYCIFTSENAFKKLNVGGATSYTIKKIDIKGTDTLHVVSLISGVDITPIINGTPVEINTYDSFLGSAISGSILIKTFVTKDIEIKFGEIGNNDTHNELTINLGATLTCKKNTNGSIPNLYFNKIFLNGILTGDMWIFCDINPVEEDKSTHGTLLDANITSNSSITIRDVDIYNTTFTGSSIKIDNVTWPERETLPVNMPPNTEDVEFPEGFIQESLNFPTSAALRVSGPITGPADENGYSPIEIGTIL